MFSEGLERGQWNEMKKGVFTGESRRTLSNIYDGAFCENNHQNLAVNYCRKKTLPQMFDRVVNVLLVLPLYYFDKLKKLILVDLISVGWK